MVRLAVHILTFNSGAVIERALTALGRESFPEGWQVRIWVQDNASSDDTVARVVGSHHECVVSPVNRGFAAGQNEALRMASEWGATHFLMVNPDCEIAASAIVKMVAACRPDKQIGIVTPKLLRSGTPALAGQHGAVSAQNSEAPVASSSSCGPHTCGAPILDAAGMEMTPSLRHLDRGSGELDQGQLNHPEEVFGGTGACLLICRECWEAISLRCHYDEDIVRVYPELLDGLKARIPLFDEAFFAYREDAELAWRARCLGWRTWYEPSAIGFHRRSVTPERRASLPPSVNRWSVRNRFLMQLNNPIVDSGVRTLLMGLIFRNLGVVAAVFLKERSSLGAFRELLLLMRRALARRGTLRQRMRVPLPTVAR